MKHAKAGQLFARKVTALLLSFVLVSLLPVAVNAEGYVPEGAVYVGTGFHHEFSLYGDVRLEIMNNDALANYAPTLRIQTSGGYTPEFPVAHVTTPSVLYVRDIGGYLRYRYQGHLDWFDESFLVNDAFLGDTFRIYLYGTEGSTQLSFHCVCDCGYRGGIDVTQPCYDVVYLPLTEPGVIYFMYGWWQPVVLIVEGDTIAPITTVRSLHDFSTASDWAHDYLFNAINRNIVPEHLQSNYTQSITRAEFAILAHALFQGRAGGQIPELIEFNDTDCIYVQRMAALGVVTGVGGGYFAPDDNITREQAAVMLVRLAYAISSSSIAGRRPLPPSDPSSFADNASISEWAIDAVGQVQSIGLMGGVGDNNFAPSGEYSREQSIVTMIRLFNHRW
jgi:hypothetical protein